MIKKIWHQYIYPWCSFFHKKNHLSHKHILDSNTHYLSNTEIFLNKSRNRILFGGIIFCMLYFLLFYKIINIAIRHSYDNDAYEQNLSAKKSVANPPSSRKIIEDRNGQILASHLKVANLIVNPKHIQNIDEVYYFLLDLFPDLPKEKVRGILENKKKGYGLIERHITPAEQQIIHDSGIPGLYFEKNNMRYYPHEKLFSHILGKTDIDKNGISGIEKYYDALLKSSDKEQNIALSVDVRVQEILKKNLQEAIETFNAVGGTAIISRIKTGEIYGMTSLPDFNPNYKLKANHPSLFNRAVVGRYEMGSTFKIINTAIGIQTGAISPLDEFDVSKVIHVGRFPIRDFHTYSYPLTPGGILKKSSNIGSVKIADLFGPHVQKYYMNRLGLLDKLSIELPESAGPIIPTRWNRTEMATISYGYGISITPLQLVSAISTILNDGYYTKPTLVKSDAWLEPTSNQNNFKDMNASALKDLMSLWQEKDFKAYYSQAKTIMPPLIAGQKGERIFSKETSQYIKYAMRLVCEKGGTGTRAEVMGYPVMGKTGTSEKHIKGKKGYRKSALVSSFIGAFPAHDPEFIIYVMVDEPKPNLKISTYATGGIVAAPVAKKTIAEISPMLNIKPLPHDISQKTFSENML